MESKIIFKRKIAGILLEIYNQHEFEVKQENFDKTVVQISDVLSENMIDSFFDDLSHGRLGVLYKSPTSILNMAYKFYLQHAEMFVSDKKFTTYEDMMKPDWKRI